MLWIGKEARQEWRGKRKEEKGGVKVTENNSLEKNPLQQLSTSPSFSGSSVVFPSLIGPYPLPIPGAQFLHILLRNVLIFTLVFPGRPSMSLDDTHQKGLKHFHAVTDDSSRMKLEKGPWGFSG